MGEKKRVSVSDVLSDFRSGLDDRGLMTKYGLTAKQLEEVYQRLMETGKLTQAEVDVRKGLPDDVLEFDDESLEESSRGAGRSRAFTETDRGPLPPSPGSAYSLPPQACRLAEKSLDWDHRRHRNSCAGSNCFGCCNACHWAGGV
jgi:hypothetical protein